MPEPSPADSIPSIEVTPAKGADPAAVALTGNWNLRGLSTTPARDALKAIEQGLDAAWDLSGIETLDSAGAFILWQAWGQRFPERLNIRPEHRAILARWEQNNFSQARSQPPRRSLLLYVQQGFAHVAGHLVDIMELLGTLLWDVFHVIRRPGEMPWREISATIHETGGRALGITALVGFLIGIVVSYLSSLQLQTLGAEVFIVNILGLSIIRELGPMLAAILVAGRSGSAMTASLGVMRVTQELDALAAMGISHSLRLVFPKVIALAVAMPLLIVWTDMIALIGGALSAHLELNISLRQFLVKLPDAVPVVNFAIGMGKGVAFGLSIALIACHFGLRIRPNTESLGKETTNSVVVAITMVILIDSLFAIMFRGVGLK